MIPLSESSSNLNHHQDLENKLGEIAEEIRDQGRRRRLLAKVFRRIKNDFKFGGLNDDILESRLVYPVKDYPLNELSVAGVDGGVLSKSLHGLDLILVRAVSSIFFYDNRDLKKVEYHPGEMPVPELINIHEPVDSRELDVLVNLKRQLKELQRAREAVEYWDIDFLMMDGSVVPQYTNHVSEGRMKNLYKELISSYIDFYETCAKKNVLLLGAVKDSRSTRMAGIFRKKLFPEVMDEADLTREELTLMENNRDVLLNSRDTDFLDYLLDEGQRTFVFDYADSPTPLLEDLGRWQKRIKSFYVKPVQYDGPLRVEFMNGSGSISKEANRTAGLLRALSANHDACALPTVLIEADARASLAEEEISILCDNISDRLDLGTKITMRRDRRPF